MQSSRAPKKQLEQIQGTDPKYDADGKWGDSCVRFIEVVILTFVAVVVPAHE